MTCIIKRNNTGVTRMIKNKGKAATAPQDTGTTKSSPKAGNQEVQFQINGQYVKQLSFEVPDPVKTFSPSDKTPEITVNLEVNGRGLNKDAYEVVTAIKIEAHRGKEVAYKMMLQYAGVFTIKSLPENLLQPMLLIQCPQFLFPFIRNIVAQTTMSAGFQPFMLAPIDFGALYQKRIAELSKTQTKQAAATS
jgi:preprotein translocase subunit SecB